MLAVAALLLIGVGLMHSLLGQKHVVAPLLALETLPRLMGSKSGMRLTIMAAWHIITLFWVASAFVLFWMAYSPDHLDIAFLLSICVPCAIMGVFALVFSKGKHLSYLFFLPIAVITGLAALNA